MELYVICKIELKDPFLHTLQWRVWKYESEVLITEIWRSITVVFIKYDENEELAAFYKRYNAVWTDSDFMKTSITVP